MIQEEKKLKEKKKKKVSKNKVNEKVYNIDTNHKTEEDQESEINSSESGKVTKAVSESDDSGEADAQKGGSTTLVRRQRGCTAQQASNENETQTDRKI